MTTTMPDERPVALLSAPGTRRFLNDFVKRRVSASDVDDVVQTVLVDALQAQRIPDTETELRRWLTGIARHKIADLHRKAGREQPSELPDVETAPAPVEERLMAEWAEDQVQKTADAERTLRWMAREGEGEKLEQIAAEEKIEAATVRQRVSRMRRWMKERWIAELAAVAVIALLGVFVWKWIKSEPVEVVREPGPSATPELSPKERAAPLRKIALEQCKRAEYQPCLEGLDRARDLDPEGDAAPEVQGARNDAKKAIEQEKQSPIQEKGVPNDNNPLGPNPSDQGPTLVPSSQPNPSKGFDEKGKKAPPTKPTSSTPMGPKQSFSKPSSDFGSTLSDGPTPNEAPPQLSPQPQAPTPQAAKLQAPEPIQSKSPTKGMKK